MALKVASCTQNAPDGLSDAPGQHRNSSQSTCARLPVYQHAEAQTANLTCVVLPATYVTVWALLLSAQVTADVLAHSVCTQSQEAGGYTLDAKSSSEANACCSGSDTQTWVVTAFLHVNLVLSLQHDRDRQ